ncbi:hypothetical protein WA026_021686 [Henosepilachna vigintioctopunctata]|uniref:Uncharacterized protein n=1 Tax=Henosepilachna vigintioctopunctata TaxID=420089 RepID=A0AAW1UCP1_9CUCU
MADVDYSTPVTQEEEYRLLYNKIKFLSSIQGSVSYILMSVLAVHRELVTSYTGEHTIPFIYLNMVFGMSVMLYTRPALQKIYKFHRFTFSLLGSLMFNQASMIFFNWLVVQLPERPWLRTLIGFFGGRLIIFYFITYLYLVDSSIDIVIFQRII